MDWLESSDTSSIFSFYLPARGRSGIAPKPFQRLRIARELVGQKLQSDEAAELGVFGLIHNAHAAATEFFDDAVMRNGLVNHEGRGREASSYGDEKKRINFFGCQLLAARC